jgi:opacity protein-like surface antigen
VRRSLLLCVLALLAAGPVQAGLSGYLGGGLGATLPQGDFNTYTENSFAIMGYGRLDVTGMPFAGLRLGLQGVFFDRETRDLFIAPYPDPLEETYTNDLFKATLGVEFATNRSSLEPYAGAGVGIYHFSSETTLRTEEGAFVSRNEISSETYFGFNLCGGLRLYFSPQVAVDFNLQYDIVKDMEQYAGETIVDFDSEFYSLFAGVTVALGSP